MLGTPMCEGTLVLYSTYVVRQVQLSEGDFHNDHVSNYACTSTDMISYSATGSLHII
jgi:hypothetical protein